MQPQISPPPDDFYSFLESDDFDPFGDDRLRLYWNHPNFPNQWSLRFCFAPFGPNEPPEHSCLEYSSHPWPRAALIRHFQLGPEFNTAPPDVLFRMSPAELNRTRRAAPQ